MVPVLEVLHGLVLAGGKSTRLGRDKTRLVFSGSPLLERAVGLLRRVADDVRVSGTDPSDVGCDAPWLADDEPGLGPLGGILTALRRLDGPVLALACDLPLMRADILETLLAARARRPAEALATMFLNPASGRVEPLVAVYEPGAASLLEAAVARGAYGLTRAVPPQRRLEIPYGPGMSRAFLNLNTPGDLDELAALAGLDPDEDVRGVCAAAAEDRS